VVLPEHRLCERDGLSVELDGRGYVAANEMERSQAGHPFDRLRVSVTEKALAVGERTRKGLPGGVDLPGHAERHPLMVVQTGANRMVVGCRTGEQVESAPSEARGLGEAAPSTFDRAQGGEQFGLGRALLAKAAEELNRFRGQEMGPRELPRVHVDPGQGVQSLHQAGLVSKPSRQ
jgi:hypothetical protein